MDSVNADNGVGHVAAYLEPELSSPFNQYQAQYPDHRQGWASANVPEVADPAAFVGGECVHVVNKLVDSSMRRQYPHDGSLYYRLDRLMRYLDTRNWPYSQVLASIRDNLVSTLHVMHRPEHWDKQLFFSPLVKQQAANLYRRWTPPEVSNIDPSLLSGSSTANVPARFPPIPNLRPAMVPVAGPVAGSVAGPSAAPSAAVVVAPIAPNPMAEPMANSNGPPQLRTPDDDHPIFGLHGLMMGIALQPARDKSGRLHQVSNPNYKHLRRDARVFGHNGIAVGSWWPRQCAACFAGAHGSWQAGICGREGQGAYSVVKSGGYSGFDSDEGDVLLYSGPGSHNNEDPATAAKSQGSSFLMNSITTQNPVRVLRSSSGRRGAWRPQLGIRYDGLYTVTRFHEATNDKGGKYYQFEMRRIAGQRPLEELLAFPDQAQRQIFAAVKDGY